MRRSWLIRCAHEANTDISKSCGVLLRPRFTEITIEEKNEYSAVVVVEHKEHEPPYLYEVQAVMIPFEGWLLDFTEQIVSHPQAMKRLEDRAIRQYLKQQGEIE